MKRIENLDDRHRPNKSWGWEEWIVNNDLYCGKRLHFKVVGGHTSMHFHMKKHETMYAEKGAFVITTIDPVSAKKTQHTLAKGDSIVIEPGCVHRIEATELEPAFPGPLGMFSGEAVLVEFSTHHEDSDSYRVEK